MSPAVRLRAVQAWVGGDPFRFLAVAGPPAAALYLLIWLFPIQIARLAFVCATAYAAGTFVAWSVLLWRLWMRERAESRRRNEDV